MAEHQQPDDGVEMRDPDEGRRRRRCQRLRPGRIITLAIVFLLLGAVVNVAVAWGLVAFERNELDDSSSDVTWHPAYVDRGRWWIAYEYDGSIGRRVFGRWSSETEEQIQEHPLFVLTRNDGNESLDLELPIWVRRSVHESTLADSKDLDAYVDIAWGWPTKSLASQFKFDSATVSDQVTSGIDFGNLHPPVADHPRVLPVRPILPRFVLNTMFYSSVLALLYFGVLIAKHRLRQRRGQCPRCGYPMGESSRCTECGTPLPGP